MIALATLVASVILIACGSTTVTVHNDKPRLDTEGNIMDIHDGNTLLVGGTYYYYGAQVSSTHNLIPTTSMGLVKNLLDLMVVRTLVKDIGFWR
jgi:hypothetical protein